MEYPLLPKTAPIISDSPNSRRYDISDVLVTISLAYLTYETFSAIWRFRCNINMIIFIVGMYLNNMTLLWIWRKMDTTPKTDKVKKYRLKKIGCVAIVTILMNLSYPFILPLIPGPFPIIYITMGECLVVCTVLLCFWYYIDENKY
ncbi:hypothetical protein ZOSMA_117G00250 [Zostera marina]|uniref:Uncharacterized protein n=1 Tax=Zostera marina TaxID=29655 RepID=A0A0K9Q3X8_ZOSMR|nr:hypothetical protein ZOSMA_117G00250 [Zostera marina]